MSSYQQHQQQQQSEAYNNFINSINSDATRKIYDAYLLYFMTYCKTKYYDDLLVKQPQTIEGLIRDYIVYLRRERNLSPATISVYVAAIAHFYAMNDITIKWKKLNKFKAKHYNIVEDQPYTRDQIRRLVDAAPLRDKCLILIMCSAGLRRGALSYLRLRDISKIEKYNLYKINVYKKEQEQYITFCTPECAKYIDQYLEWRQRLGEQLKPNSPLFRIEFDNVAGVNAAKPVSQYVVTSAIHKLLHTTGIRVAGELYKRSELMQTHGFRKYFKTTCINAGMNPLYGEYIMGHKSGLTKSYFKPTDTELLEGNDKSLGYIAAINDLTIDDKHRLARKLTEKEQYIKQLETEDQKAIEELRQKLERLDRALGKTNNSQA